MFEEKTKDELSKELETSLTKGLSVAEAATRLEKNGPNALDAGKKKSIIIQFLLQFNDAMIYILIVAAIISMCLMEWADAIIIFVVIFLNAIIGTVQEAKAEKALEALKKLSCPICTVKRDGKLLDIEATNLVVGDLVVLEEGKIVPADLRLTSTINMKVDESSLTGESVPVEKDATAVFKEPTVINDRVNTAYSSTPITYGRGEGIVVATGMNTEIGKIASMIASEKDELTPLQKKLAQLGKILGFICVGVCVVMFGAGLLHHMDDMSNYLPQMLMVAISTAVAAIPEGLPAVVAIVLALGVQKMVKVNTIVRKLPSVETLGSVSVVCSDKTGTLTQNKMTVQKVMVDDRLDVVANFKPEEVQLLASGMVLCSNASIKDNNYGDPTEIALLEFGKVCNLQKETMEEGPTPRVDEFPFDSVRKMMSVKNSVDGKHYVFTKGAMDQVLKVCTKIKLNGVVRDITQKDKDKIIAHSGMMAETALRVLALAYKTVSATDKIVESDLTFVGLVGMIDPARVEAKPAVAKFHEAGIRTIMITGDHKDTAFAIAKDLQIATTREECLSGDELNLLSEEELRERVKTINVFARVSPQNKVDIVKALKANGLIVAMTGDGVNDAPSLKAADIGIAMGITGTDVAKGAADMVLTDDNFASIEKATEQGRGIYANIKKSVLFLLSSNFGEVMIMFIATLIGFPLPLIAIHILWVNLITDSLPALALGRDDVDPDIMKEKPRDPKESLFSHGGIGFTVGYGFVFFLISMAAFLLPPLIEMNNRGTPFDFMNIVDSYNLLLEVLNEVTMINGEKVQVLLMKSQTFAFTTLGMSQLFHMIGMTNVKKSFIHLFKGKNWMLIVAFVFGLSLQVLVTEVPFMVTFFKTTSLDIIEWLWLLALASFPLVLHELLVPIFKLSDKKANQVK